MLGEWCIEVPDSSNAILPRQPAPSASGQQAYSAGSTVGAPATPGSMIPGSFPGGPFMPGIAPGGEYYLRVRESLKRRSLDKYTVADLPFALNNNECGNIPLPFNPRASVAIQNRTEVMSVAARCGVFNPLRKYKISPLTAMPRNGKEFRELGSKNLASFQTGGVFNGLDVVISQFRVPIGLDGILTNVISQFTGTGHVEGSGDIVWRVLLNNHFARNLGNILFQFGSLQNTPYIIPGAGIQLVSGQYVSLIGSIPTTSTVGGNGAVVIMGAVGWYWPRK